MLCTHVSPVVVNPVEGGGYRAHCLACGLIGPVEVSSSGAFEKIRKTGDSRWRGDAATAAQGEGAAGRPRRGRSRG